MTAIYQSPFLLALGWAIAASIWQSGIVWLLYQIVIHSAKKASPTFKHNLSLALILAAFTWFGATLADKYSHISDQQTIEMLAAAQTGSLNGITSNNYTVAIPFYLMEWFTLYLPYIATAYLLILVLLAARLVNAHVYSQKIKTRGLVPMNLHWLQRTEKYLSWLHIKKEVRIYLSEYIDVPATLNYFKPIILLPIAAFNNLSPQQIESVILHELTHIKRNDYLINIIISVIETILFFNPFVYILGKSLRREREHCCDDFVLHFRFDPHSYASALLYLEKIRLRPTPATAVAATGSEYQLLGRVKRIMNVNNHSLNYGQKLVALFVTACILISIAWLSPAKSEQEKEASPLIEDNVTASTNAGKPTPQKETATQELSKPKINKTSGSSNNDQPKQAVENNITLPPAPPLPPTPSANDMITKVNEGAGNLNNEAFAWPIIPAPFTPAFPESRKLKSTAPVAPVVPVAPDNNNFEVEGIEIWNGQTEEYREKLDAVVDLYNQEMQRINIEKLQSNNKRKMAALRDAAQQLQSAMQQSSAQIHSEFEKQNKKLQMKIDQQLLNQAWDFEKNGNLLKDLNIILHDIKGDFLQGTQKVFADTARNKKKVTEQKRKAIWVSTDNFELRHDDDAAEGKTHFRFAVNINSDDCADVTTTTGNKDGNTIAITSTNNKKNQGKSYTTATYTKTTGNTQPQKNIARTLRIAENIIATASRNGNNQSLSIALEH